MSNDQGGAGSGKQGAGYNENQADYGSPKGLTEEEGFSEEGSSDGGEGMSKEEWLRQNPDGAFDPEPAPGEGMSKEEYLQQTKLDARDDSRR